MQPDAATGVGGTSRDGWTAIDFAASEALAYTGRFDAAVAYTASATEWTPEGFAAAREAPAYVMEFDVRDDAYAHSAINWFQRGGPAPGCSRPRVRTGHRAARSGRTPRPRARRRRASRSTTRSGSSGSDGPEPSSDGDPESPPSSRTSAPETAS